MSAKPLRAVIEQLFGHHNRLAGVLNKHAATARENIAVADADPKLRPAFAQGDKWPECKEHSLRQAAWDEKCAAEHEEFAAAAKRMMEPNMLPDDPGYVDSFTGRRAVEELAKQEGGAK